MKDERARAGQVGRGRRGGLLWILFTLLAAAPLGASEAVDELNPLFQALPAARFEPLAGWERIRTPEQPLSRMTGLFAGRSAEGALVGVVAHLVTAGWGGPMGLLVAFDPEGTVQRVTILRHSETECHIPGLGSGAVLARFVGIGLAHKLRLLVGLKKEKPGDVEAVSGGTVSSRAITEAVAEARIAFHLARAGGLLERT